MAHGRVAGWALINSEAGLISCPVCWIVPWFGKINEIVKCFLLDKGQDQRAPAVQRFARRINGVRRRQTMVCRFVILQRESNLSQIVAACRASRRFTNTKTRETTKKREQYRSPNDQNTDYPKPLDNGLRQNSTAR